MSLFETTVDRSSSLQKTLDSVNAGFVVGWVLDRFSREFTSLVKIRQQSTLDVVRVIALSRMSDALKVKVQSSVKISASVALSDLKNLSVSAESTGIIPVLSTENCLKSMQELPGIVELRNSDGARRLVHWAEIEKFVCSIACFENNRKGKLMEAKAKLGEFDGTAFTDHDLFIAEFERLFNVCTSWLKRPVEDDFDKIQRTLQQCPKVVQDAYVNYASDQKNAINELDMSWSEFRVELQIVWKSAFDKLLLQETLGLGNSSASLPAVSSYASRTRGSATMQNKLSLPQNDNPGSIQKSEFQDMNIQCILCPSTFLFSVGQQEDYVKKGFENNPKRCAKCRGQVCDLFSSTGGCPYGADCKFLHPASDDNSTADSHDKVDQSTRGRKKYPCRFFEAGRCDKGDNCVFSHDKAEV